MKLLVGLAAIACCVFVSGSVLADEVKQVVVAPTARVWLQANSAGRSFEIQSLVNKQRLTLCHGECLVELPLGSYWVNIPSSEGDASGVTRLEVSSSKRYELIDPDRSVANWGRVMGITGIVLFPTAGILFLSSGVLCVDNCGRPSSTGSTLAFLSLLSFSGAVVFTPVGWVQFARNRRPRLEPRAWDASLGLTSEGAFGVVGRF